MAQKILVVEDEMTNREVAEVILRNQGFDVIVANNGQEGIERARAEMPDLIVMDILMPVLDGLSASRELKADPKTCHIPILVVTAKASNSDRNAAEAAGCDGFLSKPYRNKVLVETVRAFLPAPAQA
jgi:Response regulators consisting of a CheY-like receiver domain and a winged-helix DNA-binding domain